MNISVRPVDVAIFVGSLVITLAVGLISGRRMKTIKDYALGNKNFSSGTIAATIVATWITGRFLTNRIGAIYHDGLYAIILYMCDIGGFVITGWLLATRLGPFLQSNSVAASMGSMYGNSVRAITAIFSFLMLIGLVALQFRAGEKIFGALLGWDSASTVIATGSIIILYSSLGGIKSVTFTDVVQFFTFGALIPMLALTIWNRMHDSASVYHMLQTTPNFNISTLISGNSEKRWALLSQIPLYLIPVFGPPAFQRVAMASSVHQVRRSFLCASVVYLLLQLFTIWITILVRTENSSLERSYVFPYIVENYVSVGMMGFLLAGLMAMIMSTADSNLNSASVIFADEFVRLKLGSRFFKLVQSDRNQLIIARVGNALIGLLALLLALYPDGYFYSEIAPRTWNYYAPVVSVPLLLAIGGFRSTTRTVLMGMTAGFIVVSMWEFFPVSKYIDGSLPGMAANLITLLGTHYLLREPGGWQKVTPDSPLGLERAARKKAWQRSIKAIKNFQLIPYLKQNLPEQEIFYFFFGLYTIAATYVAFYTIGASEVKACQDIYQGICHVTLFITTAFLTFPVWPPTVKSQRFITFFWPLGMGAVLFFAGTLLVILSQFHTMQVMVLMINLLVAVLLLRWPLALLLAFVGVVGATFFFRQYTGTELLLTGYSLQFRVLYGMLLLASLLIALFRGKQAYKKLELHNRSLKTTHQASQETLLESFKEKARLVSVLRRAGIRNLSHTAKLIKELRAKDQAVLGKDSPLTDHLKQLSEIITPMALALEKVESRATDYLRLEVAPVDLGKLLEEVREQISIHESLQEVPILNHTRRKTLTCDPVHIRSLFVNGITTLQAIAGDQHAVLVGIEDTQLIYKLSSVKEDYGKKIAAIRISITTQAELPNLVPQYAAQLGGEPFSPPETIQKLALSTNHRIVRAHYGYSEVVMQEDNVVALIYVIPVQIRDVRPKDMDSPYMELGAELVRTNDAYPGADEQEAAFLEAVQRKTNVNLDSIRTAIEAIKWYHGPARRKSGEPFYLHPLEVAKIVLDYNQDEATVLGALLHDTVEDTPMLLENIDTMFGKDVASIVDGVTHLESNKDSFYRIQLTPHENVLMLLEVKDKRVLYVKIADRMHNMRTIHAKPYASQRKTAEETLQFFVPIAENLGLKEAATELKERSIDVLSKHSEQE